MVLRAIWEWWGPIKPPSTLPETRASTVNCAQWLSHNTCCRSIVPFALCHHILKLLDHWKITSISYNSHIALENNRFIIIDIIGKQKFVRKYFNNFFVNRMRCLQLTRTPSCSWLRFKDLMREFGGFGRARGGMNAFHMYFGETRAGVIGGSLCSSIKIEVAKPKHRIHKSRVTAERLSQF